MCIYLTEISSKHLQGFQPTWLYIKQHNITGLKYFGKTVRNPYTYSGSGLRWNNHLKEHGNNISTVWCKLYTDIYDLVHEAKKFSSENNIVKSKLWANSKPENGLDGGGSPSMETRQKMREKAAGRKLNLSIEEREARRTRAKKLGLDPNNVARLVEFGKARKNVSPSAESIANGLETRKKNGNMTRRQVTCPHCGKTGGNNVMPRYHFDNCKNLV